MSRCKQRSGRSRLSRQSTPTEVLFGQPSNLGNKISHQRCILRGCKCKRCAHLCDCCWYFCCSNHKQWTSRVSRLSESTLMKWRSQASGCHRRLMYGWSCCAQAYESMIPRASKQLEKKTRSLHLSCVESCSSPWPVIAQATVSIRLLLVQSSTPASISPSSTSPRNTAWSCRTLASFCPFGSPSC